MSIEKSDKHNDGQCGGYSMDNPRISEDTREKIEEAAVSVFMDQYAAALDASIDIKMEECKDMEFPKELDKRCHALIQQEYAKQKNKARKKMVLRVCRSAAVVAIALLSLCSVLFITVEAFRLPVINFFVEKTNQYWQLSGQPDTDAIPELFNPKNPLADIIPDDFILSSLSGSWESGCLGAEYCNSENSTISFTVVPSTNNAQIDSENAFTGSYKVLGHDAIKSVENDIVRITWLDEKVSKIFTICAVNISVEMVESYAESVAARIN